MDNKAANLEDDIADICQPKERKDYSESAGKILLRICTYVYFMIRCHNIFCY